MNKRKGEHYRSAHVALVELKDFRKGAMSRRVGTVQCVACLTLLTVPLRYTLTAQTRIIRTYAHGYMHIRVQLYAHTRIAIRTYAYSYTHIRVCLYAYIRTYMRVRCVFVIQEENFSLCFIVVKEQESKKATSRQGKINIFHKANGDHVTNTSHRFMYLFRFVE